MIIRAAVEIQSKINRTLKNLVVAHHFYNSACSCCLTTHLYQWYQLLISENIGLFYSISAMQQWYNTSIAPIWRYYKLILKMQIEKDFPLL